ncbi:MAG: O-antigen ligase family protein [Nitrospira sp.]|nr:O-antigen ligase family protein [Nitrospira sp.]
MLCSLIQNQYIKLRNNNLSIDKILFWNICVLFFLVPITKSPAIIAGVLSLALWILSGIFLKYRHNWLTQPCSIPVIILILLPWLSLLWTKDITIGLQFTKDSYYWLYAFVIASLSFTSYKRDSFIKSFLLGLSFTVCIATMQYAGLVPLRSHGVPIGLHSAFLTGTFSLFLVFGLLILSFYFKNLKQKKHRISLILLMALYFFYLSFVLYGRVGHLAFLFLCPLIIYNLTGKKHFVKVLLPTILLMLALSLSPLVQKSVNSAKSDLVQFFEGTNVNTSLGARLCMWELSTKLFLENPIFGSGSGGFKIAWRKYKPDPNMPNFDEPHNTFFYIMANFGILGMIPFIWLFIVLFHSGWRCRNDLIGFTILSFSMLLFIGSLFTTMIAGSISTAWVTIFIGLQRTLNENPEKYRVMKNEG